MALRLIRGEIMSRCEDIQSQFLDYLYGLLDAPEAQALRDHLQGCSGCQAAMVRAEGHKRLLGAAAKIEFPQVRFSVPGIIPLSSARESKPVLPPVRRTRVWGRWAVAAAALLLIGGFSIANNAYWQRHDRVLLAQADSNRIRSEIQEEQRTFAARRKEAAEELQAVQQEQSKFIPQQRAKIQQKQQEIVSRQLHLSVSGPPTVEAGAANDYQVRVHNLYNQPIPAEVTAIILDDKKTQLASAVDVKPGPAPGIFNVSLPRNLPAKPDADLYLVVKAKAAGNSRGEVSEKLALAAPVYLTHLATDKPMYRPGEVVKFRSLTVERFTLKPVQEDLRLEFSIKKPMGAKETILRVTSRAVDGSDQKPVLGPDKEPIRGIGAGEYQIPPDANGGEFTLTVSEANNRFPPQERKFIVNRYENPRLNKDLEFTAKSYGPGDEVVAAAKAMRVEGGVPVADADVTAVAKVDGVQVANLALKTNAVGGVRVKFPLPRQMERGDATLSITFKPAGSVETIVRPIPIVLKKLHVEFFPEGGDLVAGLPNRVYFQARTTLDKPAELNGRIVDDRAQVVAEVSTLNDPNEPGVNQGMGRFEITPEVGRQYQLKIDSPTGIEGQYMLPKVDPDGVVMAIPDGVTTDKDAIHVVVRTGKTRRQLLIGAYCRGRVLTHERLEVVPGQPAAVDLRPAVGSGGVYRVTAFEEQGVIGDQVQLVPRAERLVYRVPAQRLNLTIQPDKPQYVPGDRAILRYKATNENGKAVPAVLMVAVTDKSVLKLADEKTFRMMPTHFLLTTEVRKPEDLEYADFMLSNHPKAPQALDLLLGTQGWRRFAEQNPPDELRRKVPDDADRLLVYTGRLTPESKTAQTDFDARTLQEMVNEYNAKYAQLQERREHAEKLATQLNAEEPVHVARITALKAEEEKTFAQLSDAGESLAGYQHFLRDKLLPAVAVFLLAGTIVSLVIGLRRANRPHIVPYVATAVCSFLLLGLVIGFEVSSNNAPGAGAVVAKSDHLAPTSTASGEKPTGAVEYGKVEPALGDQGKPVNMPVAPAMADKAENRLGLGKAADQPFPGKGGAIPPAAPAPRAMKPAAAPAARQMEPKDAQFDRAKRPAEGKAERLGVEALKEVPGRTPLADEALARQKVEQLRDKAAPDFAFRRGEAQAKKQIPDPNAAGGRKAKIQIQPQAMPAIAAGVEQAPFGAMPANGLQARRALRNPNAHFLLYGNVAFNPVPPPPPPPFVVREYAHAHIRGDSGVRQDFTETLYWHPLLVLPDGTGESTFDLSDSVTTFQALVAGHTLDGRIGAVTAELEARKPITLEPKLPIEVTANDKIDVALSVANNTDVQRGVDVHVQPTNLAMLDSQGSSDMHLSANGRARKFYRFQPIIAEGDASLRFEGRSDPFTDSVSRSFRVVPEGFPITGAQSDMLEGSARHELVLPETWIKGTLKYQVAVYPSTLADLQKGLEALLREPHGCFEQTSTSNYPNLLILDYLKETDQAKPDVARQAQGLLDRGYQKLVSFECLNQPKNKREGYEWFGGTAPAHEALTAFGLMQFRDMARVYNVDKNMLERTRAYLMARKDGKGGFQRNPRALDTFGRAPDNITNAYIVWALTESGKDDDVTRELGALAEQAKTSTDPYFLALVANSLINRDRNEEAVAILKKVAQVQKPDGYLEAAQTSITGSGGRDLQIETTALSILAWLKAKRPDQFNANLQSAVKWIGRQRGGYGGYGSTQSTILTLKALIAYARANKKTAEAGELVLYAGAEPVVRKHFPAGVTDALVLELPDPEKYLKPGKNDLQVEITGKSTFPYTAAWSYQSLKPASSERCAVGLKTSLDRQTTSEGETVRLSVQVENKSGKGQGMTVAIVGLPAGLTMPEDMKQLKDLARLRNDGTERGPIDAWEVNGREVVLYWRDLAPDKKIDVHLELICRVPGEYRGPASRAYLYYNADHKSWADPLAIAIDAKTE
jgi:hypothetical protein